MDHSADKNEREARFSALIFLVGPPRGFFGRTLVLVVIEHRRGLGPADAGRQRKDRNGREPESKDDHGRRMATENAAREEEQGVAEDTTEAGRQRPSTRCWKNRGKARCREATDEP